MGFVWFEPVAQTMTRTGFFLVWTFTMMMVSSDLVGGLGVNWGTMASHTLSPSTVVNMLKDNGIKKVKLFDADPWTVNALAGTDIEVMLAIPNFDLQRFADSYKKAKHWVKENVTKHLQDDGKVNIRYVGVGNEPFLTSYNGSFVHDTFPALENIQKALNEAGHGDKIKATVPLNADVYESSSDKPSDGNFRSDIRDQMVKIVHYLHDNDAPFTVNIYPFLSLYQNVDFPEDFAFFDNNGRSITDKNIRYTNVFDANFDTLVWSLKKVGVPDLKIVVGEVGWPTDGHIKANVKLAKRFYDGLLKNLGSNKGTPMRPGSIEMYLFGLFDEDVKSIAPGMFERHWGIFRFDGVPKFEMDFTGRGNDKMPVGAKGVVYLENKWCVAKEEVRDFVAAGVEVAYACATADCTSLGQGHSCAGLDARGNVSYAFNMYYQTRDQSFEACNFRGMGKLVTTNPSTSDCVFPIQIESGAHRLHFGVFALLTLLAGSLMSFLTFV